MPGVASGESPSTVSRGAAVTQWSCSRELLLLATEGLASEGEGRVVWGEGGVTHPQHLRGHILGTGGWAIPQPEPKFGNVPELTGPRALSFQTERTRLHRTRINTARKGLGMAWLLGNSQQMLLKEKKRNEGTPGNARNAWIG